MRVALIHFETTDEEPNNLKTQIRNEGFNPYELVRFLQKAIFAVMEKEKESECE